MGSFSSWTVSDLNQLPLLCVGNNPPELLDIILLDRATDVVDVIGGVLGMVKSQFPQASSHQRFPALPFLSITLMDLSGNPAATYTNCVQRCRIGQTGPLRNPQPILGNDEDRLGIFLIVNIRGIPN